MNKQDIKLYELYYFNTTGAYNTNVSQIGRVVDIGINYIWFLVGGNLGPIPVLAEHLSENPLYKVTNAKLKDNINIEYFRRLDK